MKSHSHYSGVDIHRSGLRRGWKAQSNPGIQTQDGFVCKKCDFFITTNSTVSGVQNRNHCPCCLWSRHMDLHKPGDRLSACKALMKPIGLTCKRVGKKYMFGSGELMLVHQCTCCGSISINRIAADDIPQVVIRVLEISPGLSDTLQGSLRLSGIKLLSDSDVNLVRAGLFGYENLELEGLTA